MTPIAFDYLACEPSCLGMIGLRQREIPGRPGTVVTELTLDHAFLMGSHDTASERALARHALDLHQGSDLDVLIGGLGLGYTAREALACERVARVEVVELLAPVISWLERGLLPLSGELSADPRLRVREGDAYARLAGPARQQHDLILIDVDHSPHDRLGQSDGSFYSEAGLACAGRHLRPGGLLGLWSCAESPPLADALRATFGEAHVVPVHFDDVIAGEPTTHWLFFARAAC